MVKVISRFRVRNAMEQQVRDAFEARPRLVERAPGFLGMEVHVDADDPAVFYLETRWTRRADFDAWHRSDDHKRSQRGMPRGLKIDPGSTAVTVLERIQPAEEAAEGHMLRDAVAEFASGAPDVHVLEMDLQGRVRRANAAAADWLGRQAGELVGMHVDQLLAAHDRALVEEGLAASPCSRRMTISLVDRDQRPYALNGLLRVCAGEAVLVGSPAARDLHELQSRLLDLTNELAQVSRESERRRRRLESALDELRHSYWHLKKIQEVLPICMSCARVKTGESRWQDVVDYLRDNSLFLSHGLCPECYAQALRAMEDENR